MNIKTETMFDYVLAIIIALALTVGSLAYFDVLTY